MATMVASSREMCVSLWQSALTIDIETVIVETETNIFQRLTQTKVHLDELLHGQTEEQTFVGNHLFQRAREFSRWCPYMIDIFNFWCLLIVWSRCESIFCNYLYYYEVWYSSWTTSWSLKFFHTCLWVYSSRESLKWLYYFYQSQGQEDLFSRVSSA